MYSFQMRYTFIWSFIFAAFVTIIFHKPKQTSIPKRISLHEKYEKWFHQNGLQRTKIPMDTVRYGDLTDVTIESDFLYKKVNLLCVVLVRKRKNAVAANNTWAKHCNDRMFIYLQAEKVQKTMLPIRQEKIESSWHLLCEAIRTKISTNFDWVLFVFDDTFAMPENVRKMVAALDPDKGYYLGHAISFWGTVYNVGQAGYILSRGSVNAIKEQFNSTERCVKGGRFWKREDYYLGKHLSTMGITPMDTRDSNDLSTFHRYNLVTTMFPESMTTFADYYKYSVYPVKCCSPLSVTFQTVEGDKMYTNYYLIYSVQLFLRGGLGNRPAPTPVPEEEVWKSFIREQGMKNMNITSESYYELWKNVLNDPVHFNQNIKKWNDRKIST